MTSAKAKNPELVFRLDQRLSFCYSSGQPMKPMKPMELMEPM